jgi:hypothetical protein
MRGPDESAEAVASIPREVSLPARAWPGPGKKSSGLWKTLVESRKSLSSQGTEGVPSACLPKPAAAFVVGTSFFLKSVLTVRKGLAYNPPIDAAPRFTGPTPRPLKLLIFMRCIKLLISVRRRASVARSTKGGSPSRFQFFDN